MATSKPPKPPGQYDVGYGKPPAKDQFKPGRSGNPGGRRRGQPTPNEIFMREAARLVKVKRGDTVETITKHEAIIRRLLTGRRNCCRTYSEKKRTRVALCTASRAFPWEFRWHWRSFLKLQANWE